MRTYILAVAATALFSISPDATAAQHEGHTGTMVTAVGEHVPLYDDLGNHHYEITTTSRKAQRYFDQGLRLYYAFNHQEAVRSFREAQRLDPRCAMCWWGEALAWGPNINLPMDSASAVAAYEALQGALATREHASDLERALIDALVERYAKVPPPERAELDAAYADQMAVTYRAHPRDPEVAVLYAEALMDLRPWDYWKEDGTPQPGIEDALSALRGVMQRAPDHPGACHFYIHAVEKLYPEKAVPCAERLADAMPGAGHLVHMPGHIYIRVGRYLDALRANEHAVHADETYIQDQNPAMGMYTAGYYPHNYDFMVFAATMIGRRSDALRASLKVAELLPQELFGTPGMDFLQHWSIRPLQVMVRFGAWDEILATAAPPRERGHARAVWHYARGRAYADRGDQRRATEELAALRSILSSGQVDGLKMEFNRSPDILGIAESVLAGWTEVAAGRHDAAVAHHEEAVRRESALLYGEPPEWTVPARHDLGATLLLAGRASEAQAVFERDLEIFPDNGWSLHGLWKALEAQGLEDEAARAEARFRTVWEAADVQLGG